MSPLFAAAVVATVTTIAGMPGVPGFHDGAASSALFNKPTALTIDASTGDLYVIDRINQRVRKVAAEGAVSSLPSSAEGFNFDGPASGGIAQFSNSPTTFPGAYRSSIFVCDTGRHAIERISAFDGVRVEAGLLDRPGFNDGSYLAALFDTPTQIIIADDYGTAFVCDTGNHAIRELDRLVGFGGDDGYTVRTLAGSGTAGSADGIAQNASFSAPRGIAIAPGGSIYVSDTGNHTIRVITRPGAYVQTIAGRAGEAGWDDAVGTDSRFNSPTGIAVDEKGFAYVADTGNCVIRSVSPSGVVSTIAGTAGVCGFADGAGRQALFNGPVGIVSAANGVLYVADTSNHVIRKVVLTDAPPRRRVAPR